MQEPSFSASREAEDASSPSGTPPSKGARASVAATIGQKLAAAREREGLSVRETADRLHVVTRYVTAIEAGEYTVLPGIVFLKGYVRAYARIVGLDEDALSQALEAELQIRDDVPDHSAKPLPHSPKPKSHSLGILAGLFALALVALVAFLLVRPDPVSVPSATTAPYEGEAPGEEEAPVAAEAQSPDESEVSATDSDGLESEKAAELAVEEPVEPSVEEEFLVDETEEFGSVRRGLYTTPDPATSNEQVAEPVQVEPASTARRSASSAARPVLAGSAPTESTASGVGDATVSVVFTGDCWFDIRAANDERTVGLYREGQTLTFKGPLPMEVIVGAVGATQIRVNGQPLDFSRYRVRNNRVEFTITSETLQ
ncbi:helix-turn-helix domain-containing protein [Allohahella sp. A8]|uniref:helix-turn-helix domain-containing protein n=1 Tax=Allohahella sp. A8 TaxID=3141461 RepID=UPI003A810AF5